MIGIAENDLRIDILFEESALYTLDGTNRTNRHKNRGLDIPMVSMHNTRACARVRIRMYKVKKNFLHSVEIRWEVKGERLEVRGWWYAAAPLFIASFPLA